MMVKALSCGVGVAILVASSSLRAIAITIKMIRIVVAIRSLQTKQ